MAIPLAGVAGEKIAVTSMSIVAALAVGCVMYWLQRKKKNSNEPIPTQWKPIGKVDHLFIYPLKSGKKIEVNEAYCTPLGLKEIQPISSVNGSEPDRFLLQDRFFMIYQEESQKFLTARQKNITLLLGIKSAGPNAATLTAPNSDEGITFKISKDNGRRVKCSMHDGEEIDVVDCGDEVAGWLSKVIFGKDSGLRLGYYPDPDERQRTRDTGLFRMHSFVKNCMTDNDFGAYSDVASYMLLSQNSLDDLKKRLEPDAGDIGLGNFRPNVVVSGLDISPYDEDNWRWIKIGQQVIMKGFKPCTRCTMVTLDPVKGQPNPSKEPLLTLKKYRQVTDPILKEYEKSSPVFGRYFGLYNVGHVSVGDVIYIPA